MQMKELILSWKKEKLSGKTTNKYQISNFKFQTMNREQKMVNTELRTINSER